MSFVKKIMGESGGISVLIIMQRRVKKISGRGKTIILGLDTKEQYFFFGQKVAM